MVADGPHPLEDPRGQDPVPLAVVVVTGLENLLLPVRHNNFKL